eukprot:CAMPEP_0177518536 /NCGR_PEP_ID=MMETSP0369-20130122/46580_1 /TAXON_ID=447022 ORGANISM="Scrippsiella hangoei-like, Strain SHHI-4" /NCGR_SAMPLE_ID=MMETSP0369 /ASSEMBLY_ACC=CAM_ASM_000364 /LENGTH=59 /DNA_ID=CAMNT_0018997655 /DNA_START=175 /DNA_END=351 /DNA_ORIENTATION=+
MAARIDRPLLQQLPQLEIPTPRSAPSPNDGKTFQGAEQWLGEVAVTQRNQNEDMHQVLQ